MELYRDHFGTPEMREVFSEASRLEAWLAYEGALAWAQGGLGIIPPAAAEEIAQKASLRAVPRARIIELYRHTRLDTVALTRALAEACSAEARGYVHFGSTTTDIYDTGLALQLKDAWRLLVRDLRALSETLARLAVRHRHTVRVARTHSQHALPITLGFTFAMWLDDCTGHLRRLLELRPRLLVGKVTGVVGSQASFGSQGLVLQARVCERLGLGVPDASVQLSRARYQEFLTALGLVANTVQQIAKDVWTKMRTEIGELHEHFEVGTQVGSTTLAFKRNPTTCEWLLGLSRLIRRNVAAELELVAEDERDGVRVAVEQVVIPESCLLLSTMLDLGRRLLDGLAVDEARMAANLQLTKGLVFSEPIMMELARRGLGKQEAHEVLYDCATVCYAEGIDLAEALRRDPRVTRSLAPEEIAALMDPTRYLGTIQPQIDAAIARAEAVAGPIRDAIGTGA
ncbi:MAG TPA: adenylosuccinate lyase [bacterium]|nr:adenylosuccinate lyase [bacterium]